MKWVANTILAAVLLTIVGCGSSGKLSKSPPTGELEQQLAEVCDTLPQFVAPHDGDSATFTAYARAACGGPDLDEYETRPGRYERWPLELSYSWNDLNSSGTKTRARSENSKDMYLAIMARAWLARDLATLEDIYSWGKRRGWVMGDGRFFGADTVLSTNLRQTLAEMIYQLGGPNDLFNRFLPVTWTSCDDYECWNLAAHLALRLQLFGRLGPSAISALRSAVERQPHNPLPHLVLSAATSHPHHSTPQPHTTSTTPCDLWPYRRNDLRPLCPEGWPGDWAFYAKMTLELSQ